MGTSRTVGGPQRSGDQVEETQDAAHSAEGDDAEEIRAAKLPATRGAQGRGSAPRERAGPGFSMLGKQLGRCLECQSLTLTSTIGFRKRGPGTRN